MNRVALLLPALLCLLACSPSFGAEKLDVCKGGHRVTCVVDGDTLWLNGEKIRLEAFDAPEVSEPKCPAEKQLGDKATARLTELLNGADWKLTKSGHKDKYRRTLGTISIGGKDVGDTLIAEGLAHRWIGHKTSWCG